MLDRIVNILIIEENVDALHKLLGVLHGPGNNIFTASTAEDAVSLIDSKNFAIVFCSLDLEEVQPKAFLATLTERNIAKNSTLILTSTNKELLFQIVGNMGVSNAVDYLIKPYIPNLVNAKIKVYKKLYFKHLRVSRLLESILPSQTLEEFQAFGKSSPKKKENCVILFTDFVNFTQKTKNSDPQSIVKKLDYYFSKFDEIILKYRLEKIKTIGDAYMAVAGVTEPDENPALRTALAAMEIRNFMEVDILTQKALKRDFWDIRIGVHSGKLVAGVVGTHKFSFDVWGDSVNIAARCEQNSLPNRINISVDFYQQVKDFFECEYRGPIEVKNGGRVEMYFLNQINSAHSFQGQGRTANQEMREFIGLPAEDFYGIRQFILNKLKAELNENLLYHSVEHTLRVEKAVLKYAQLEGLSKHELFLVQTAALFHDSGFLYQYDDNEQLAVELFKRHAPDFGYNAGDIQKVVEIIQATASFVTPKNLLEAIMCDADLDYLGRMDYHATAKRLFLEMERYGKALTPKEQLITQLEYLEKHHFYYTTSAKNLRGRGKQRRIEELKKRLEAIELA